VAVAFKPEDVGFGRLFWRVREAIVVANLDGRIVLWNPAAEHLFGYTAAEAMGLSVEALVPDDLKAAQRAAWAHFIRTGRGQHMDDGPALAVPAVRRDGQHVAVELTFNLIVHTQSGTRYVAAVIRDVSERAAALEAVQQQATLLDLAHDAILVRELGSSRIQFWNRGAERLYGWTKEEALGQSTHQLLKTRFPKPLEAIDAELVATGHWEGELIHNRRDGSTVVVASSWTVQRDGQGRPVAHLEINTDITARRQAEAARGRLEQQLVQRAAELEAANRELEAFNHSVSHDLRAPLRSIDGFSQALLEDYAERLDGEAREYLELIRSSAQELGELMDALLLLSRIGRAPLERAPIDLSGLAREIAADLARLDPQRPVVWSIADGLWADGDRRLLRIALENLLGNAWKFSARRSPAHIELGASVIDDGEPAFFVRDNGDGFDPTYADKLFGAFQRLHSEADFPGTGIGLATVQRIIHRHGGRIWAAGRPGRGATFTFTLPRTPAC
jgi:PAS domain S-box-containing protein